MKRLLIILSLLIMALNPLCAQSKKMPPINFAVDRIDPPYWWTGMKCDTLQLMVYGQNVGLTEVTLKPYAGVAIDSVARLDSHDYMMVYLTIGRDAKPGTLDLIFNKGKRKVATTYQLKERTRGAANIQGFDASDVLYLIMPDRFARAGETTDAQASLVLEYPVPTDRANPNARHGGNIAGMKQHLGYVDSLGVTAIWVNPVLTNDMPGGSYHGYATTDYYSIDPRFGSNKEWNEFVADAHSRGLKVVMDMIFNHCGSNHPWLKNRPTKDWFNFPDKYEQTNYRLSTLHDPYASDYDKKLTVDGWFVEAMPDLNQRNPHLMKYLIQNSIWWIESSKINGIRMDTYPYADEKAMAGWIDAVLKEYPRFNIVGECWYSNEGGEAYWQRNSRTNPNGDPRLPVVMDFALSILSRDAFNSQTDSWNGLNKVYDHLALDYLFANPQNILTFLDNHDTDRFLLEEPDSLGAWKQAQTFLLTSRGIPQIYYGTEILMNGSKQVTDGHIRLDMPGGFKGDTTNVFSPEGRTPKQQEAFDFLSKLLNWRRGNEIIAKGSLKHFMPTNGLYVYRRQLPDGRNVIVIMNGNDSPVTVDMERYGEILPLGTTRHDFISGRDFTATQSMTFEPRQILILE